MVVFCDGGRAYRVRDGYVVMFMVLFLSSNLMLLFSETC